MFFTKNDKMPGSLLKARSDRSFWCCYSLHSSASKTIDFLSSLHFESITPFVSPDKDTPLDSVKTFIVKKLKHQNPNPSNDATTKLWKERIKFNERGEPNFIWRIFQQTHQTTNTIGSHCDNRDALLTVEVSRERI